MGNILPSSVLITRKQMLEPNYKRKENTRKVGFNPITMCLLNTMFLLILLSIKRFHRNGVLITFFFFKIFFVLGPLYFKFQSNAVINAGYKIEITLP